MNADSFHPEDLLELDASGQLSPDQAQRLEHHLRHCEVCRFERHARAAFRNEPTHLEERVSISLLLAAVPIAESPAAPHRSPRGPSRHVRTAVVVAAFGTVAVTSAAAAGLIWLRFAADEGALPWRGPAATSAGPERPAGRSGGDAAARSAPSAPSQPMPTPAVPGVSSGLAVPGAPRAAEELPSATQRPRTRSGAEPGLARPEAIAGSDAPALFARANEARRAGERHRAIALYQALIRHHAASPEAHHARAVLGRAFLDDGRPDVSLRYFDSYLQRGGALAEDVLFERAVALQRLGRVVDEASAWRSLLAASPTSVHAARARARLAELGER